MSDHSRSGRSLGGAGGFGITYQATDLPLNLEMAATDEMVAIATRIRPADVCVVPERREEVTTEGGLDVALVQGGAGGQHDDAHHLDGHRVEG